VDRELRARNSESTPRGVTSNRVLSRKVSNSNKENETARDATHSQRSSINLDKTLQGSRKHSSTRNLEANLPDFFPGSTCSSPSPRRLSRARGSGDHKLSYDGSEVSVSYGSVCPKLLPSTCDSPHRTTSRRLRVSNHNVNGSDVHTPSSVRRFSNRPPNSPHSVSIDRNRRRSMREQGATEKSRSLLEMHLAKNPRRSRAANENVRVIEGCRVPADCQRLALEPANNHRPKYCSSPAQSRYSASETRTKVPTSPESARRHGLKSNANRHRIMDLPFAPLDF
jgi:hypothetical protein